MLHCARGPLLQLSFAVAQAFPTNRYSNRNIQAFPPFFFLFCLFSSAAGPLLYDLAKLPVDLTYFEGYKKEKPSLLLRDSRPPLEARYCWPSSGRRKREGWLTHRNTLFPPPSSPPSALLVFTMLLISGKSIISLVSASLWAPELRESQMTRCWPSSDGFLLRERRQVWLSFLAAHSLRLSLTDQILRDRLIILKSFLKRAAMAGCEPPFTADTLFQASDASKE
ncbi:hypothetical protein J3F83DRAFT_142883 [Trichoderma novae-zelandiae]